MFSVHDAGLFLVCFFLLLLLMGSPGLAGTGHLRRPAWPRLVPLGWGRGLGNQTLGSHLTAGGRGGGDIQAFIKDRERNPFPRRSDAVGEVNSKLHLTAAS